MFSIKKILTRLTNHTAKMIYGYVATALIAYGALSVNAVKDWVSSIININKRIHTIEKNIEYIDDDFKNYIKSRDKKDSIYLSEMRKINYQIIKANSTLRIIKTGISETNEEMRIRFDEQEHNYQEKLNYYYNNYNDSSKKFSVPLVYPQKKNLITSSKLELENYNYIK